MDKAGRSNAARIAMIAITTSSSIKVKAHLGLERQVMRSSADVFCAKGIQFVQRAGVVGVDGPICRLDVAAEPPPTRDVNRDSGTDRANGG